MIRGKLLRMRLESLRGVTMRCLYTALVASIAINTPTLQVEQHGNADLDILRIQSLVAQVVPNTPDQNTGNHADVLELQRTLAGAPDREQQDRPENTPTLWATAPAAVRAELLASAPALPAPEAPVQPLTHRPRARALQMPPLPRREAERYRMRLTPHAPPAVAKFDLDRVLNQL